MKVAGIIVEFNPFHDGHAEHLRETKNLTRAEKIVAVMSGNFVQRGEPAIYDKWRRTKTALEAGVDIVIEIPAAYVLSGADYFARAGVNLLAATGVVDALSFGSESGNLRAIENAGRVLADEPPAYKNALAGNLRAGKSFAAARGAALAACLGETPEGLLTKPNNTLAMEYCKASRLLGNPMEIFTTLRAPGGPSATKIRRALLAENPALPTLNNFSDIFRYLICTRDFDLGEGLENRFRNMAGNFATLTDFLAAAKTKRYTRTRLQRAVLRIILGIEPPRGSPEYIRVLGFRRESENLLSELTKKASLPVITSGAAIGAILAENSPAAAMLAKELEAGDIYRIATKAPGGYRSERGTAMIIM